VPIDLEVVCFPKDIEQPTKTELNTQSIKNKLVSERKYKGLTEAEKTIIRQMREGFLPHTSRFVPLGTYLIVKKLVDMSNYRFLSSAFEKTILANYTMEIQTRKFC